MIDKTNLEIRNYVEVSLISVPELAMEYAVLCNRTKAYIRKFLAEHPDCFVFPFYTAPVDETPDFFRFKEMRVAQPFYVGNLKPWDEAIEQIVGTAMGHLPTKCVFDDRKTREKA